MKKYTLFIIICILFCACGKRNDVPVESAVERIDTGMVKVAVMPTLDCLPLFVAKEHKLFDKSGLKIALCPFTAQMDIDTALIGGSVKGAVSDVFRCERMQSRRKLTYITNVETQWSLISNRTARLNKLEQFGDKMVAMTRYSATDYLTECAFKDVKTTAPYFKIQINDVNLRLNMLINNEMDAAWLPEPQSTQALKAGHKRLETKDKNKYGVLVFSTKYLKNKQTKEFIDKLRQVYSESCDSINKYGVAHYAGDIMKYCNVDTAVINSLPRVVFTHAEEPSTETINLARTQSTKK